MKGCCAYDSWIREQSSGLLANFFIVFFTVLGSWKCDLQNLRNRFHVVQVWSLQLPDRRVGPLTSMTGGITLSGNVLPIRGINDEKTLIANAPA